MTTHELVKIKRKMLNLSQTWFAERLGVEQPTISRAENGLLNTTLNKMIALLLQEFPEECQLMDFYPEPQDERFEKLNEDMSELKTLIKELVIKMDNLETIIKTPIKS